MERNRIAAVSLYDWLQTERPDVFIVPNGTILEMGVAYQIARLLGIQTVTFEFADQRERIWIAQDGEIMAHDTSALWEALGNHALTPCCPPSHAGSVFRAPQCAPVG